MGNKSAKQYRSTLCKLFGISEKSFYRWRNDSHRKFVMLIEKYFSTKEIEEFLETDKIEKLELIKNMSLNELESNQPFKTKDFEDDFDNLNNNVYINNVLLKKVSEAADEFGMSVDRYIEHLIVQDLRKDF